MISKKEFLEKYNIPEAPFKNSGLKWSELEKIYNDYESRKHEFEPTAKDIVERLLKVKAVHSVRYRIKDSEHLIEKIIRKKTENKKRTFTVENYTTKIDDIIGVRALHLFKDEWDEIDLFIMSTWKTKEKPTANIRKGDPEEFTKKFVDKEYKIKDHKYGYRSVHYILESSPTKKSFVAEIQVRTIFEEGWSEIDHTIRYPYDIDNPILKQYLLMFNRLAGNADEMGTYIKFLQTELHNRNIEFDEILSERERIIDDLKSKIESLKIDRQTKTAIGTSLDHLLTGPNEVQLSNAGQYYPGVPVSGVTLSGVPVSGVTLSGVTLLDNSVYIPKTCPTCGNYFVPIVTSTGLQVVCKECSDNGVQVYQK